MRRPQLLLAVHYLSSHSITLPNPGRPTDGRRGSSCLRTEQAEVKGGPRHPQTQGKDERLHRTLKAELLNASRFDPAAGMDTLDDCQHCFDDWRTVYNYERPHHALHLDPPGDHYQHSSRPFPEPLPPLTFPPGAIIRTVSLTGQVGFRNQRLHVGVAFQHYPVGLLYDDFIDSLLHVYFSSIRIRTIDLST